MNKTKNKKNTHNWARKKVRFCDVATYIKATPLFNTFSKPNNIPFCWPLCDISSLLSMMVQKHSQKERNGTTDITDIWLSVVELPLH